MKIILYFDENAQDSDLMEALVLRGVGVIGAQAAGMRERSDEKHLVWAAAQKRVLYSFNIRDYCRLHAEFLAQGKFHAGIILAKQQNYSGGRANAEIAQADRNQACGGNDKPNRVSLPLGVMRSNGGC